MRTSKIKKLADGLTKILQRDYVGDGLYVDINEIKITDFDINYNNPCYIIVGHYGRYTPDGKNNFQESFTLVLNRKEKIQFVYGMFYQLLLNNEEKSITKVLTNDSNDHQD